jgi:hypothetical protein
VRKEDQDRVVRLGGGAAREAGRLMGRRIGIEGCFPSDVLRVGGRQPGM